MHILQVTPYYAPAYAYGGVVRAVEGMARALVARGHQVTVLTTDALDGERVYEGARDDWRDGVRVVRVPNIVPAWRARFNLSTPRHFRAVAQRLVPAADIVHCHEFRTVENLLVTPIAVEQAKPLVLSAHGTLNIGTGRGRLKRLWDTLFSPTVARRFDHIIALTATELAEAQALWPQFGRRRVPATFGIIPNGIHPSEFMELPSGEALRQRYQLGDGLVVLFMGRLHPRKGLLPLAQAFVRVAPPSARLLVVGPDEGMAAPLRALGDARIVLTGLLTGEERLSALSAADLFALPATGEGLSMAALEAMAAGLPLLLSPGCNLPEAEAAGAACIVPPTTDSLAVALEALLASADLREAMGKAARQLALARFTWEGVAEQLEAAYQRCIAQSASGGD